MRGSRQIGEEEFVDHARARDANRTLLLAGWMSRHHHAARHPFRPYRDVRTVVEAAHRLAFRTLLKLIGRQVQTRLDERVIEHAVLFAAGHKREPSHIGEHRSRAILPIKPRASCAKLRVDTP